MHIGTILKNVGVNQRGKQFKLNVYQIFVPLLDMSLLELLDTAGSPSHTTSFTEIKIEIQ